MPQMLTTNAIITCPHGGIGTTIPTSTALMVESGLAVLENDPGTLTCVFQVPCVGYTLRSMGLNATTVESRKAILATDFQQSFTGMPLTIVETNTVFDDSTPAPIPLGSSPAALSPELLDPAAPVVVAVPPVGAFNSVTMLPPTLPIAFTLSAAYPLQWMARLLNTVAGTSLDLTNGLPGATPVPAGGTWSAPVQVVTVTMTAVFLAAQGPGAHHLYMIGVTRRGISAYAEVVITVS